MVLWEQHCCLPLTQQAPLGELERYQRPGGAYVSVNVGYAPHSYADVTELIAAWAPRIAASDVLRPASGVGDIADGRVAVAFDLEDSGPLEGRLDRVREFYDLGVRTMLPTYNTRNAAGHGCLDAVDEGLTAYGRDLLREMNAAGMVADGSHCSIRTGLDLCRYSEQPVVYSHSCMRAVWDHPRNVTDEQARACAETGGVIGITGVGIFLGANEATVDAFVRHIEHAVDLVGPEHVGLSTDFSFDGDDLNAEMQRSPHLFPAAYTAWGPIRFTPPEGLFAVEEALRDRGYPPDAVAGIVGGNFLRVATQVWR
ncbi:membrane dipeptidase [Dactylosporangium matsuzakiense]|nr:membrane dipeptidase [Dactylosporangium matsuzakiense]